MSLAAVWLSAHVLAAILCIGPLSAAVLAFPRTVRAGWVPGQALLHQVTRYGAVAGLAVPAFGLATANELGVLTDPWLLVSIGLTIGAALLLVLAVLPQQKRLLAATAGGHAGSGMVAERTRAAAAGGTFVLIWGVVVVLMIVRPGSTTGV